MREREREREESEKLSSVSILRYNRNTYHWSGLKEKETFTQIPPMMFRVVHQRVMPLLQCHSFIRLYPPLNLSPRQQAKVTPLLCLQSHITRLAFHHWICPLSSQPQHHVLNNQYPSSTTIIPLFLLLEGQPLSISRHFSRMYNCQLYSTTPNTLAVARGIVRPRAPFGLNNQW